MSRPIRRSLKELFPKESGVKVISEPGRFFVEAALTLAVSVIGKRSRKRCDTQLPIQLGDASLILISFQSALEKIFLANV